MTERLQVVDGTAALFAVGDQCTWYGPVGMAVGARRMVEGFSVGVLLCPWCGGGCAVRGEEEFWQCLREAERQGAGEYAEAARWGQGRCFPEMEALRTAYLREKEA